MKTIIRLPLFISVLILVISSDCFAQQWRQTGLYLGNYTIPSTSPNDFYLAPDLAFNSATKEMYVAYVDGNTHELEVKKYGAKTNKQWVKVGVISGNIRATKPALAFNPVSNEPYIIYINDKKAIYEVKEFDGTSWVDVGSSLPETAVASNLPTIGFKAGSPDPYIAFVDNQTNSVVVKKMSPKDWVTVGGIIGNINPNYGGTNFQNVISIAFHPTNNELYISYIDTAGLLAVKYFSGDTAWVNLNSGKNYNGTSNNAKVISTNALAFHPKTYEPYVGFIGNSDATLIRFTFLKKRNPNGTTTTFKGWQQINGVVGATASTDMPVPIVFNSKTNNLYSIGREPGSGRFWVGKFDGKALTTIGVPYPSPPISGRITVNTLTSNGALGGVVSPSITQTNPALIFNSSDKKIYIAAPADNGSYEVDREP